MSLKAYDGMMSRKSIKYIQDEIIKRLDKFKDASENELAEKYANLFVDHFDGGMECVKSIGYEAHGDIEIQEKISKINIDDDTTILSYIFQASKILCQSTQQNGFMVHLNISLEAISNRKILVYPNIIVHKHKDILLEFLEDWYCQNSSDPDEDVPRRQWRQREKDWNNFNENQHFNLKIQLFDPTHYWNGLHQHFRGENLINKILEHIPSDEKRIRSIAKRRLIKKIEKELTEKGEKSSAWNISYRLSEKGNTEIDDYIKSHDIKIYKFDAEFIKNARLNHDPNKEIRKEKLKKINEQILENKK
jgi:hypothetical protein